MQTKSLVEEQCSMFSCTADESKITNGLKSLFTECMAFHVNVKISIFLPLQQLESSRRHEERIELVKEKVSLPLYVLK